MPPWTRTRFTPYLASSRATRRIASRSFNSCGGPLTAQNRTGSPVSAVDELVALHADEPALPGHRFVQAPQVEAAGRVERIGLGAEREPALVRRGGLLHGLGDLAGLQLALGLERHVAQHEAVEVAVVVFGLSMRKASVWPPGLSLSLPTLTHARNRRSGFPSPAMFTRSMPCSRSMGVQGPPSSL